MNEVKVQGSLIPQYQTSGSAGCDLCSIEERTIPAGHWCAISTGLSLEIPDGFVGMVCPRSGLAMKHGVTVLNSPGIIDSDFRGIVKVILINHGTQDYVVSFGDRIAQLVFSPISQLNFVKSEELSQTSRGEGGFGSTGR